MGKQLNSFYRTFMNPGLIAYLQSNDLDIEWIIEAGCHDGADTKEFLAHQRFKQIFAFEPDPVAFKVAKMQLKDYLDRVTLRNVVLMDKPGAVRALPLNGEFGTGSTIFSQLKNMTNPSEPITTVMASRLDDEIPSVTGGGALWLDVEGSAHLVLCGGTTILKQVRVAQIEIDMHAQSIYRNKNYRTVLKIMSRSHFCLIAAPLNPGFFGDALFVKAEFLSLTQKTKSLLLHFMFITLHSGIYPLLGKPKSSP